MRACVRVRVRVFLCVCVCEERGKVANGKADTKAGRKDTGVLDYMRDGHQYWMKYARRRKGLNCQDALQAWKKMSPAEKSALHKEAECHNQAIG